MIGSLMLLLGCGGNAATTETPPGGSAAESAVDLCLAPDAWEDAGVDPCGPEAWVDLVDDGDTVFVCTEGDDDGDGSMADAMRSITAALERAEEQGLSRVAVAVGRYDEAVLLDNSHDGMRIEGACRDGVELTASEETEGYQMAVVVQRSSNASTSTTLAHLSLRGGESTIGDAGGTLYLEQVAIRDADEYALVAALTGRVVAQGLVVSSKQEQDGTPVVQRLLVAVQGGSIEADDADLLMRDWTVGVQVSQGDDSSITLSNCRIRAERGSCAGCASLGIYAEAGVVSTTDCQLIGLPAAGALISGADLRMTRTTIKGTTSGDLEAALGTTAGQHEGFALGAIMAAYGAQVTLDEVLLDANETAGISLSESTLDATGLIVRRTLPGGPDGAGIGIASHASEVRLSDTIVDGAVGAGIGTAEGGSLTLSNVQIRNVFEIASISAGSGWGLGLGPGVTMTGQGVLIEDAQYLAVDVRGQGAIATIQDLEVRRIPGSSTALGGTAVSVVDGAAVDLQDCVIEHTGRAGLVVTGDSTLTVTGCTIRDNGGIDSDGWAVLAADCLTKPCEDEANGPSLTITDSSISDGLDFGVGAFGEGTHVELVRTTISDFQPRPGQRAARGIVVGDGAFATAEDTDISDVGAVGALVFASSLTWRGGSISGTYETGENLVAIGLGVQDDSDATLHDVELSGTEGPGLFIRQSTVTATELALQDNRYAGATLDAGSLAAERLTASGNTAHHTQGGGVGLLLNPDDAQPADLQLHDSSLGGHDLAGLFANGAANVAITTSQLAGSDGASLTEGGTTRVHGNAAFVRGGTLDSTFCVEDSTFSDATIGLLLHELTLAQSVCSLTSNSFTGNDTDVVQQPCGMGEPVDWPGAQVCPEWELPTVNLMLDLALSEPTIDPGLVSTWSP